MIKLIKKCKYIITKPLKIFYSNIPDRIKYGRKFRKTYDFLQRSQNWSKKQLEDFQLSELKKLMNHAYNNVPYYKRIFDERNLKPDDIKDFNDIKKLPYLTKAIIKENFDELKAVNYKASKLKRVTTGGTTGMPMAFLIEKDFDKKEWAFITSQWKRIGYDVNKANKVAVLRGNIPNTGYYEFKGKQLILSSFLLNKNNYIDYVKKIEKHNPDFIQAYPSSIAILSKYISESGIKLKLTNLKAILCGSENLHDYQRKMIEGTFKCRVYSWYGHSEVSCLAGECEINNLYHILSEYGYVELINKESKASTEENENCEIIATSFNNYAMPFIRYKTCDIAVNTQATCSCGRHYRLIKRIFGREQEYFVDRTGSGITSILMDDPFWNIIDKVIAYQYIQDIPGEVTLCVQADNRFSEEDKLKLINNFKMFYPTLDIIIRMVENIPKTNSGKFKYLVQNLSIS